MRLTVLGAGPGGYVAAIRAAQLGAQVTIARMFTFAIAGIRPSDAIVFVIVQIAGALAATFFARVLFVSPRPDDGNAGQ